jgi:hypothetical protein
MLSHLSILVIISWVTGVLSRKSLSMPTSWSTLCFPLVVSMFQVLVVRSLIHLDLIFVQGDKFQSSTCEYSAFPALLDKKPVFSAMYVFFGPCFYVCALLHLLIFIWATLFLWNETNLVMMYDVCVVEFGLKVILLAIFFHLCSSKRLV